MPSQSYTLFALRRVGYPILGGARVTRRKWRKNVISSMKGLISMGCSMKSEFLQPILGKGFDGMPEIMQNLFNPARRSSERGISNAGISADGQACGSYHTNGYKLRAIQTLNGELKLNIPQTGNTDFRRSRIPVQTN